jgi:hypothetical protein
MANERFRLVGSAQAPTEVGTAVWWFAGFCQEQSIIAPDLELITCGTIFVLQHSTLIAFPTLAEEIVAKHRAITLLQRWFSLLLA